MKTTNIRAEAGNSQASLVAGSYRRARFRSTENLSFQQTDGPITSAAVQTGVTGALTSHRPDDATIDPSLLFWRVEARAGFCPISESTMDLASRFASLAVWR